MKESFNTINAKLDLADEHVVEIHSKLDMLIQSHSYTNEGIRAIKDSLAGISTSSKWVAASITLMAISFLAVTLVLVASVTKTSFSGSVSGFGASGNISTTQKNDPMH